jgi:hypothetical protein
LPRCPQSLDELTVIAPRRPGSLQLPRDGAPYWRSLTTISDPQIISKIGEISKLKTYMPLLLTYFHMYWVLSVLRDIYMKYMGSMVKVRKPESVKQILQKHNKQKPTQLPNLGQAPM